MFQKINTAVSLKYHEDISYPQLKRFFELKLNLSLGMILKFYLVCKNEFLVVTAFHCNVNQETLNTEYDIIHSI